MTTLNDQIKRRRTFGIISHPDAGKTTITEKLLLYGGAIQLAGTVKGRKAARHATSDWMELEKQRGISVTTSVMQFEYRDHVINLLDTPGHEDFSEDTYRTLTAVDSALMVIDSAKGVEERTIKLMDVCRLRDTPIVTFINKLDREGRDPMELLDEVEDVLGIQCAPITWPIGMGKQFKGVFNLVTNSVHVFSATHGGKIQEGEVIEGIDNPRLKELLGHEYDNWCEELELVIGASHEYDQQAYLEGKLTPVFFGSAINNFGVQDLLNAVVDYAPAPLGRESDARVVKPEEKPFSGFVFKIQANMDPSHRDRIAFLRVCSGTFTKGDKIHQVRIGKDVRIANAVTFMASDREHVGTAYPGDIIGMYNHGTIQVGDSFTDGEDLKFVGIPFFAPELFRRARLKDPLRSKALLKGLQQLSEEGATQLFRPLDSNDLILGAVGVLQFDVVAHRLKDEYKVECIFEPIQMAAARWVQCDDEKKLEEFKRKVSSNLALDGSDYLTYLATSRVNLDIVQERYPDVVFSATREV